MVRIKKIFNSKFIRTSIFLFFIGLFIKYYFDNPAVIESIIELEEPTLWYGVLFTFINIFTLSAFLKFVVDALAKTISYIEAIYTTVLSTLANYVLPLRGGLGIRAVYLKRNYDLSYSNYAASLYGNYVLILLVNSLIAIISILHINFMHNSLSLALLIPITILFILGLSLTTKHIRIDDLLLRTLRKVPFSFTKMVALKIDAVIDGWKSVIENHQLRRQMVIVVITNFASRFILFIILFSIFNLGANLSSIALFTSVTNLTLFISLTPGAVGIRETILLVFSNTFGITSQHILAISLLERAIMLTTLAILIIPTYLLNLHMKRQIPK